MRRYRSTKRNEDSWLIRRRVMILALLWAGLNVQYLILWGNDTRINETVAMSLCGLIFATIGTYVFGAVWEDNNKRKYEYETLDIEDEVQGAG